jgi:hypothetical protein
MRHWYDRFNPVYIVTSLFRLTNRQTKTRKKKPLKNFLVDGYVNFALCQSQSFDFFLSLTWLFFFSSWTLSQVSIELRDPSFIYIIYIYSKSLKKKMFILFAVHSPPSALVSFIFLEILFPLYSACPSLCPRCHLLIHVKLGKEASRYQNVGIEIHFVCLVNPRFKNKQTNTKKKYPSSVANRLPKPNSTGVNSIGWFSFSFFYFFINSKKSPKIPFLRGDNQFWWKFVYFSVYYSFFFSLSVE